MNHTQTAEVDSMENLITYEQAIQNLADAKDGMQFSNSGKEHATIVMSNIFRTAKDHVRIFAGDLCGEVSKGKYLSELKSFLDKGHKLSVIVENPDIEKSEALKLIRQYHKADPTKVKVSYVNAEKLTELKESVGSVHFTIGDERMYRFETDTANYTAICSFNNKPTATKLISTFNSLDSVKQIF